MSENGTKKRSLVLARRMMQSPRGSLRPSEESVLLEHTPSGSNLRVWDPPTTPKMAPSKSGRRPLKARRCLDKLSDKQIENFLMDSGSECTTDEDEDEMGLNDHRTERDYLRNLRNEIVTMEAMDEGNDQVTDEGNEQVMDEGNEQVTDEGNKQVTDEGNEQVTDDRGRMYEGLIAIGADGEVERVLKEERMVTDNVENEQTMAQEYANIDIFTWSDDFTSFSGQADTYLRIPGPTIGSQTPVDIFKSIWDNEIMSTIVKETNEYAWRLIAALTEEPDNLLAYLIEWTEVSVDEMYRYFSILILMSICIRSKVQDYWSTDLLEMAKFRQIMSRNRFILITKFLHFVDNDELNLDLSSYDKKIFKIRPILEHCNKKFAELYVPNKHLSLDESLLLWKGRLSWVQCIRTKAARFGIKSYELCEAVTGYQLRCLLYAGKESTMSPEPIHGFENCTAKVVLELMDGYLNVGHTLVMDNWYNQLPLVRFLKKRKTDVIGTLNPRQLHVPDDIKFAKEASLKRGEQIARHCGDMTLVSWKDVKLVTAISTCHGDRLLPAKRAGQDILKPETIVEYNRYMGGVDSKDQKLSMYLMERKRGKKWYIKVFKRLLNTSILNAFIIYRKNPALRVLSHRDFRMSLAKGLLANFNPVVPAPDPTYSPFLPMRLRPGQHFVAYTEKMEGKSRRKQKRCVRCTAAGRNTKVILICSLCHVPLCPGPCFAEYHTLTDLK